MRAVPVHNLRPNHTTWTPAAIAYLDAETTWTDEGNRETHRLRCWCAQLEVRRGTPSSIPGYGRAQGVTGGELGAAVDRWARRCERLWVYAHNLSFDLAVTGLVGELGAKGWHVTDFAIDSPAPFVRLRRKQDTLTLADSFSWLPARLDEVAHQLGMTKPALPDPAGDADEWAARCAADTAILAAAMATLMDWWEKHQLGRWSVTGTAAGWNAMRHITPPKRITVNPDPAGIAADRQAIYSGRRGVWRTGRLPRGRYAELDFTAAYPTVAAHLPLPHERLAPFDRLELDSWWLTSERHGVIARCRIRTDTPRWPVRHGRRVWYPVGEYTTTLAGPDLAEALAAGALYEVGPGWKHRLGLALAPWARWVLETAADTSGVTPQVAQTALKHWGRAVIGKWAQHGFTTVDIGPAPTNTWWAGEAWNHSRDARAVITDFGGRRWQATADGDVDDCYPAILAWVESHVRVRLGRMLEAIPAADLVACDTDGAIADIGTWDDWPLDLAGLWPLEVRAKRQYADVEVFGPQHLILDGERRFAGVPASAQDQGDGTLRALLWPKLAWQMGHGQAGAYTRPAQTYRISAAYAPGWILQGGAVVPVQMRVNWLGANQIVPWPETSYAAAGARLAAAQNKDLEGYRDE